MAITKKHPKPDGPMTEFILMPNDQYKSGEAIPININGYAYQAVVGQRNKLPKDVLSALQDAKSTATAVPDLDKSDPYAGRQPRSQEDLYRPPQKWHYQNNWQIEVLKEEK